MNWEDLKNDLAENGNVHTVTMETLRNIVNAKKLGKHVNGTIKRGLASHGIGHIPERLPNSQADLVRLYQKGTLEGDFIADLLLPSQATDQKISERLQGEDAEYANMIAQIRDIILEN